MSLCKTSLSVLLIQFMMWTAKTSLRALDVAHSIFLRVCIWNELRGSLQAPFLTSPHFSSQLYTSSLLGAECSEEYSFLLPLDLSRSASVLDRLRVRPQQRTGLTDEVLERLSTCAVPLVCSVVCMSQLELHQRDTRITSGHS